MPITYNVENDGLYLMGVKTGIERGIERGIEKGIERGILKMILRALEKGMSYEALSELSDLSVDAIKEIDEKRLDGEFKGFTQQDDHLI